MREIKFRLWNFAGYKGENSKMFYDTTGVMECLRQQILYNENKPMGYNHIGDGSAFMQFTGVKDKNDKEIYEGDIVEAWSEGVRGIFQIKFRLEGSPCWLLWPNGQHRKFWNIHATEHKEGKQFITVGGQIESTNKRGFYDDGLTVLGNIYENPELLIPTQS